MASSFSFGFSGDDIDRDDGDGGYRSDDHPTHDTGPAISEIPKLLEARSHTLEELLSSLPSRISYNILSIPLHADEVHLHTIPRREIFDIRAQLMAEEDIEINENEDILSGLENGDIKPTIYEGGFKTWECAVDLAKVLAGEGASKMTGLDEEYYDLHIIELGAGTGIPSLALFRNILHNASAVHLQPQPHRRRQFHFTFGDYNQSVLRLATLPNILLAWSSFKGLTSPEANGTGDLEVTPDLLREFTVDLECFGVRIDFISGAWGEGFVDCAVAHDPTSHTGGESSKTLVLASESIYAPSSLQRFTHTLLLLLLAARSQGGDALALVAAKRVYFGVGGGVDEFRALITTLGATVEQMVEVKDGGVGRVVLQIRFDVPVLSS